MNALGLFDLDRNIRAVGSAYRELVRDWEAVLPTKSMCLQVPVVMPHEFGVEITSIDPEAPTSGAIQG